MAPLLEDPRIRQTWNQFSQNAESATETAAAGIWTFQHAYINPCFSSISASFQQCTGHCFSDREERARRRERGRTRGRVELTFDFYDDWDEDDGPGGLLGRWGNDELDRLLAGSGSHSGGSDGIDQAPRRKRGMSYGTRGTKRKSLDPDPTVIPSTSVLGFLGRLPWKLGGTLRYKPSAADLQEHPGGIRVEYQEDEAEPLIPDEHSEDEIAKRKGHTRQRSSTTSSGETTDSFRSRGDLFPSDGEDDAVPLSDEFAMALERRATLSGADDRSSGKTRSSKGKRPAASRGLSRNLSSGGQSFKKKRPSLGSRRASSGASVVSPGDLSTLDMAETPSLTDLQREEERVRLEEDGEVERKRQAAVRLAQERGLHAADLMEESMPEPKQEASLTEEISEPSAPSEESTKKHEEVQDSRGSKVTEEPRVADLKDGFVPARLPNFG